VEDLAKRVESLERMLAISKVNTHAECLARGRRLRTAIEEILTTHPHYSAKHVLKALSSIDLGRQTPPSVRTVQYHVKVLRNMGDTLRTPSTSLELR